MREFIKVVIAAILVIFLILLVVDVLNPQYGFFAKVNAGHVGIVDKMGNVQDEALQPGFHVTGFFSKVVPVDARIQKSSGEMEAFSKDIQQAIITMSINYCIQAEKAGTLYKSIGMNYSDNLIRPRLLENTKVVIGDYTAETLIAKREEISEKILQKMKKDMEGYGINVTVISIENIDFTDAFEAAVEAKQVATQEKQRAKTKQEQLTLEAEQEAERRKIAAEAEAETAKTKADAEAYGTKIKAEAEAEANKKVSETLTNELIEYTKANQWNGQLPNTYMGSGDGIPVLNVGDINPFEAEDFEDALEQ